MSEQLKVIDCLVCPNIGWRKGGEVEYLFPGLAERLSKPVSIEEMLAIMDESGIEKGLFGWCDLSLNAMTAEANDFVLRAVHKHPDRFVLTVVPDPRRGMQAVRELETWVKDYDCKAVRLVAHLIGVPNNDKIYYPLYAKAIELDIPMVCNVGIPGPWTDAAEVQNPIYLDEVLRFLPELRIVMQHIGDPWIQTVIKLMVKWQNNLFLMTSAFAPRHYPKELIHYMNTRGADKVMFASDWPVVPWDRCIREIAELPLRDHVRPQFLRENAIRVFRL